MNALVEFKGQLYKPERTEEFANLLPKHMDVSNFQSLLLTAVMQNPDLLNTDRLSLFNAGKRAAHDGLPPDGRHAVISVFKNRAVYMPMVAGIRRLVQQSGEITRFEQSVVYERDRFSYQLGDDPHILHVPELGERGRPIMAYSIAQFRDGTLSREVMTVDEIEKVRANSRAGDSGPWKTWWPEMARKTVAKRHAKFLPMSNDAADAIKRDSENDFPATGELSHVPVAPSPAGRPRLAEQLNSLGHTQAAETPRQTRGRPRKHTAQQSAEAQKVLDHYFPNDEADDDAPPKTDDNKAELTPTEQYQRDLKRDLDRDRIEAEADDGWPGPDVPPNSQSRTDMLTGRNDALAGRRSCLNKDIANNPKRFADWRRGFDSVARGQTK